MSPERTASRHFHTALAGLKSRLLEMSGLAEDQVRLAMEALRTKDEAAARRVIERDQQVDELELELDRASHELLALQSPWPGTSASSR